MDQELQAEFQYFRNRLDACCEALAELLQDKLARALEWPPLPTKVKHIVDIQDRLIGEVK